MNRPLVVFAGQGLSQADGFHLVERLRKGRPSCFEVDVEDSNDLDQVVAALRKLEQSDPRERQNSRHHQIHKEIENLCTPDPIACYGLTTTADLCRRLAQLSLDRLIVLFTSNVDMACRHASLANGAKWFFGTERCGCSHRDDLASWFREIEEERRGLHFIPLHGEPTLTCTGSGGIYYATTDHRSVRLQLDPGDKHWNSLVAVGLGGDVIELRERVWLADRGFGLLEALLRGSDRFGPAADLLLVGYGAGSSERRRRYPLERSLDRVRACSGRASWHAVSMFRPDNAAEMATLDWLVERDIAVHRVQLAGPTCAEMIAEALTAVQAA